MFYEAVRIAGPGVDGACGGTASNATVKPEDVCGSDELIAQMGTPARVVTVTEEEY